MAERRPVLLTVSGTIPDDLDDQVAAGRRARADYVVMSEAFDADLVDVPAALAVDGPLRTIAPPVRRRRCRCSPGTASVNRKRYEVIVTDGEQVGIPLALFCRLAGRGTARHMMIVHILSTRSKALLLRWARLAPLIDRYVVYSSWQRDFIVDTFDVPTDRVILSTFMVDTAFFDPAIVDVEPERMICAAGLERRDYPTLMEAVDGLDVKVVIAAASPWSKQSDSTSGRALPANVEVRRLSLFELRDLYAASRFVVMPLVDVEFQAGITTILEAMSMARAVVCTQTAGQTDTVIEGETGRLRSSRRRTARCGVHSNGCSRIGSSLARWARMPANGRSGMPMSSVTPTA